MQKHRRPTACNPGAKIIPVLVEDDTRQRRYQLEGCIKMPIQIDRVKISRHTAGLQSKAGDLDNVGQRDKGVLAVTSLSGLSKSLIHKPTKRATSILRAA